MINYIICLIMAWALRQTLCYVVYTLYGWPKIAENVLYADVFIFPIHNVMPNIRPVALLIYHSKPGATGFCVLFMLLSMVPSQLLLLFSLNGYTELVAQGLVKRNGKRILLSIFG
jgi:hypothetical protein